MIEGKVPISVAAFFVRFSIQQTMGKVDGKAIGVNI